MRELRRFWSGLEAVPGLQAVSAQWRAQLGEEHDFGRRFLAPTGELASTYPFTTRAAGEVAFKVVQHGPDDYVAVHPDMDGPLTLHKADLVIYRLNHRELGAALTAAFSIDDEGCTPLGDLPHTWRIGVVRLGEAERAPVALTVQYEPEDLRRVTCDLIARIGAPFALLCPTRAMVKPDLDDVISRSPSCFFLALDEVTGIGDGGKLRAQGPLADLVGTPDPSTAIRGATAVEAHQAAAPEMKSWPDPTEHTVAKCWTTQDGAFHVMTKTDGKRDGETPFGADTLQSRLMQTLCQQRWRSQEEKRVGGHMTASVSLRDAIEQVYPDRARQARSDGQVLGKLLKLLRSLVSDIRTKKLEPAGINPDILPALNIESSVNSGISLRVAHLHYQDAKTPGAQEASTDPQKLDYLRRHPSS